MPTYSKIVQINHDEVYIIGDNPSFSRSPLVRYDAKRCCLLINLKSATITEKTPMLIACSNHGIAHINNYIYAIAGHIFK